MMLNIRQISSNNLSIHIDQYSTVSTVLLYSAISLLFFRLIASASFDKSVRLWRASDGAFISTFRGHVQAVYSVAWSADSRLFVTGSKDSTLKGIF